VEGAASSEPDDSELPDQEQTLSRSSADEPEGKSDEQCAEEDPANEGAKLKKKPDVSAEILKFIGDSLEPLAKAGHELNAFNRFGLTLYFAGAGQYMATRYKVSDQEITDIICAHVQTLGHTAEMARGFCANDAAQLVVHEHNSIVRDALALHTGDGIMATFGQITNAVEGAVAMQQACMRANADNPELGLALCIGVNAGEPIHEDGDIFGTPMQMAARVLSKAEGEEIAVSNLVREMYTGKSYKFNKKGDFDLKGFPEPVPIFLVDWAGGLSATEKPGA